MVKFENSLVTGCDSGFGLAFVKFLSQQPGVKHVFAGYINLDKAEELKNLSEENPKVVPIKLHVDDDDCIRKAKEFVEAQIGDHGLDLLINNAGINEFDDFVIGKPKRDVFMDHFNINTIGPVMVTAAFLPLLRKAAELRAKSIVLNISSNLASIKNARVFQNKEPRKDCIAYGHSKASLNHFTRSLAYYETKNGIISVSAHPGWLRTNMGGPNGAFLPYDSAEKLINIIAKFTVEDSGRFFDREGNDMEF